jgi:hypothetical protein
MGDEKHFPIKLSNTHVREQYTLILKTITPLNGLLALERRIHARIYSKFPFWDTVILLNRQVSSRMIRAVTILSYSFLIVLVVFSLPSKGETMSLLPTSQDVVLSSPLEGILTINGKPVSGVKILRKLSWFDLSESVEDAVVTDGQGYFALPIVRKSLKLSNLTQFVVTQEVNALYDNNKILIWYMGKDSKNEYGELGGKPVNLKCELTSDEIITRDYDTPLITRCYWDSLEPQTTE